MPSMVVGSSNLVRDPEKNNIRLGVTNLEHPVSTISSNYSVDDWVTT